MIQLSVSDILYRNITHSHCLVLEKQDVLLDCRPLFDKRKESQSDNKREVRHTEGN